MFNRKIKIFHIASMARSGETVLLRTLNAHSKIQVVHNLKKDDDDASEKLFDFLKGYEQEKIKRSHPLLRGIIGKNTKVLLLKQGVWSHKYPFWGVVLSRNPASIYASLKTYDRDELGIDLEKNWFRNTERMMRWLKDIDVELQNDFPSLSPVDQFCMFYNARMGHLANLNLPVVHYERFVQQPEMIIKEILKLMRLSYEEKVMNSHAEYESDERGHGKMNLNRAISVDSLYKYQKYLTRREFDEIADKTQHVHKRLKYKMSWSNIELQS